MTSPSARSRTGIALGTIVSVLAAATLQASAQSKDKPVPVRAARQPSLRGVPFLKLSILPVTPYQQNCSLVVCATTGQAALVDPGGEVDRLLAAVEKAGATLSRVLVTHGHVDHCFGVELYDAEGSRARVVGHQALPARLEAAVTTLQALSLACIVALLASVAARLPPLRAALVRRTWGREVVGWALGPQLPYGGGIGGEVVLPFADADQERRAPPRTDDDPRISRRDNRDAIGADDFAQGTGHRGGQRMGTLRHDRELGQMLPDQVGQHFGIRRRMEGMTGGDQALLDPVVVFNDAVVDDRHLARPVEVRMGIFIAGRPMRGPTGVTDATMAGHRCLPQQRTQALVDLPLALAGNQRVLADDRHPRAVVAAIFQPPQPLQKDGGGLPFADVSDDAAHIRCGTNDRFPAWAPMTKMTAKDHGRPLNKLNPSGGGAPGEPGSPPERAVH